MTQMIPLVLALCLVASVVTFALVRYLRSRMGPTLRAKVIALFVGLVGVELSTLPALLAAFLGNELLGLNESGFGHWLASVVYAALILYTIARLFPWREVESLAADPDATIRDVLARIRSDDG